MNRGHIPAEVLASYADGSLADGMCLIVAGHLTFCPRCRDHLDRLEALGGALLSEPAPGCCAKPDLGKILSRLDQGEPRAAAPGIAIPAPLPGAPRCAAIDHLPRCLRERLGSALTAPGWRAIGPGLAVVDVPVAGLGTLRLLRCDAGVALPEHEHAGPSAALILRGSLCEDGRSFGRGDLILSRAGDRHAPVIGEDGPCVVLMLDEETPLEILPGR
ncbi:cupin domain-containing protein [Amaricoccus solimangrovi]|nr:cupin domain-containing protein [Amaricoccus solimangrovi]